MWIFDITTAGNKNIDFKVKTVQLMRRALLPPCFSLRFHFLISMGGLMKKIIVGVLFGILALFPMVCAAWMIHLKDGRSFETPEYLEEGDQIKFELYGGLIGIPKNLVAKIEESSPGKRPLEENRPISQTEVSKDDHQVRMTGEGFEKKEEDKKNPEKNDLAYYKKKKLSLQTLLDAALEKYNTAKLTGDEAELNKQYDVATRLAAELEHLKKEVKRKNYGFLPLWWN